MASDSLYHQLRRFDTERSEQMLRKLREIFPPHCRVSLRPGTGILEICCPSVSEQMRIAASLPMFLHLVVVERVTIQTRDGGRPISCPTAHLKGALEKMNNNSLTDSARRIADRVLSSDKPTSIVSIGSHRNIIFNRALMVATGKTAEDLRARILPLCWLRPEEMGPDTIAEIVSGRALPYQMTQMLQALRQQGTLETWRYYLWNNDHEYGQCVSRIEHVRFQGEDCRLIVTLGFEPVNR